MILHSVQAGNVDEVLAAHDAYLREIHAKALLTDDAEALRATLRDLFALARALLMPLSECRAEIAAFVQAMQQVRHEPPLTPHLLAQCPHK